MDLLVIGLSHRTAPVALRERLAVESSEIDSWIVRLRELPGIREATLVSTCNRTEIYAAYSDPNTALAALRQRLSEAGHTGSGESDELAGHLYERLGSEAVHHLFRVAASLDSMVVGEPQILGQLKDAFDHATRAGGIGPTLEQAFSRAFRVARRIRRETGIAKNPVSISSVAVDLARLVWEGFEGRRVLLIGAGKMADLAARALKADGASVAVTNRTAARAEELASRLGALIEPWEQLREAVGRADIVISSTGARRPILSRARIAEIQKARRGRPLVIVDIAVPRDVEPEAADIEGVFLYDIDHLQGTASRNLADRRQEADRAESLVEEEVGRFLVAAKGRSVGPTIAALRARVGEIVRAEAEKTTATLSTSDEKTRAAVVALADAIIGKLMHGPSVALKKGAGEDDGMDLAEAARRLFQLPLAGSNDPEGGKNP